MINEHNQCSICLTKATDTHFKTASHHNKLKSFVNNNKIPLNQSSNTLGRTIENVISDKDKNV